MTEKRLPFLMFPPGQILIRELEAHDWTQKDLAEIMGRPEQAISEIINAKKQITPETAIELGRAFGISSEFWMNLETNYQLWLARKDKKDKAIARRANLYSLAPVPELKRKGWIRDTNDIDILESDICSLLGISSPDKVPTTIVSLRDSKDRSPETNAQIVWVKRVEQMVRGQKPEKYSLSKLKKAIPRILKNAIDADQIAHIPKILLEAGIRFSIVPHLSRTFLDGAAFRMNGNPVVALTLRYDRIDSFWFTLMHELAHHALGHKGVYLDVLYGNEQEKNKLEIEANRTAQDWLVNPHEYKKFIRDTRPYYSKKKILEFAQSQMRHPGIIIGRLHYDGEIKFSRLRSMLVKVKPILDDWYDKPMVI